MKILYLFLLISCSCYAQNSNVATIGYTDQFDKLPKLNLVKSTQTKYDSISVENMLSQPKLFGDASHISIQTKKGMLNLKKYGSKVNSAQGFKGYQYAGYYPSLQIHALFSHHTAEHIGFSDLILVDDLNAKKYAIASVGDDAVQLPIPSANGKYLVYFYNWMYQRNSSFIGVLKVGSRKHPQTLLAEKASYETKKWAVEGIKWLNDSAFIVKASTENRNGQTKVKQYAYYLAQFKP